MPLQLPLSCRGIFYLMPCHISHEVPPPLPWRGGDRGGIHTKGGAHTQKAVHTQGSAHTRLSVATAGVLSFTGVRGLALALNEVSCLSSNAS